MFAIIGSGFGLYGYLPALAKNYPQKILLPKQYSNRFNKRPELIRYASRIDWVEDKDELLHRATGVVLAVRPEEQHAWVNCCVCIPGIRNILLEKPLAASPEAASLILHTLKISGKEFRIAYTLKFTSWAIKLKNIIKNSNKYTVILLKWHFLAHHFRHDLKNWKLYSLSGGGAVRFYGIHIIALLSEMGYDTVQNVNAWGTSTNEIISWKASFSGPSLPLFSIDVDTKSDQNLFEVKADCLEIVKQHDPFNTHKCNFGLDPRVSIISKHLNSFRFSGNRNFEWYNNCNILWSLVEKNLNFEVA